MRGEQHPGVRVCHELPHHFITTTPTVKPIPHNVLLNLYPYDFLELLLGYAGTRHAAAEGRERTGFRGMGIAGKGVDAVF